MKRVMMILAVVALGASASAGLVPLVDNTSGQTTINGHQLESTGGWGDFAEDASSSSYDCQVSGGYAAYKLSGELEIGGNDGQR